MNYLYILECFTDLVIEATTGSEQQHNEERDKHSKKIFYAGLGAQIHG